MPALGVSGSAGVLARFGLLKQALALYQGGRLPVLIDYRRATVQGTLRLGSDWSVRPTDELLKRLRALLGAVALIYAERAESRRPVLVAAG